MNRMIIANILVGLALLILGRRLFWFFVGAIGFIGASDAATTYLGGLPGWQTLIISIAAGILGILLAIFFQKLAIVVVGFYAGGYLAISLLSMFHVALPGNLPWVPFVIGGILGAILLYLIFDWTLIVLSSFAGAAFIAQTLEPQVLQSSGIPFSIVLAALFVVGIIIQGSMLKKRKG